MSFDPAAGLTLLVLGRVVRLAGRDFAAAAAAGMSPADAIHRQRVS